MKVSYKVDIDDSKIKRLEKAQQQALEMTGTAMITDIQTSAVTPKNIGELERDVFLNTSKLKQMIVSLVYSLPYARRLYWHPEYNFRQDKNPNAQGRWMDMYVVGEKKDFAQNTFSKLFKQLSKGLIK